jgi:hypothetical protein
MLKHKPPKIKVMEGMAEDHYMTGQVPLLTYLLASTLDYSC